MANGALYVANQQLRIPITLGERRHVVRFLILPDLIENIILGMDFLRIFGTYMSIGGQTIQLTGHPMHQKPQAALIYHLECTNQKIQPQGESSPEMTNNNQASEEQTNTSNTSYVYHDENTSNTRTFEHNTDENSNEPGAENERGPATDNPADNNHDDETANIYSMITPDKILATTESGEVEQNATDPMAAETTKFIEEELAKFKDMTGISQIAEHTIAPHDERPIKIRYQPRNPAMQKILHEKVDKLLEENRIEPSNSPYSAPAVLTKKKNGEWRLCMDFRVLNSRTVRDAYPLPRIHQILDRLRNSAYFSTLDLRNGYWQIPMAENSKKYTAFTIPGKGLFQWKVMPFGLHSAPATFQRALDSVIGPEMEPYAFAYLDDIVVTGATWEEHRRNLQEVFRRLREAKLYLNAEKCEFFKREIRYLGHLVDHAGIHTDPDKIAAIKNLTPPTNVKEVRRCLGIASWYRRFVPDFSKTVHPLTALLKKRKHFRWGPEQQEAFEELKRKLTEAPVLTYPDFSQPFILQTDACDYGLGAVLTQEIGGQERVISYASRTLSKAERNYSTTEKECLAIVWGVRKMRPYLEGYHFIVVTDHLSLKWLNSIENPSGRIARWALELQQYSFDIRYRKGKQNVIADALSRQPIEEIFGLDANTEIRSDPMDWVELKKAEVTLAPERYPDYRVENGHLYRHLAPISNDEDCAAWKLCVPTHLRSRVLADNHDVPTAGHLGTRKTIARITSNYYWPRMFQDIRRYIRQCESCQKYKPQQRQAAGRMLTQFAEEPWVIICADFVGPLPRSSHGNTMLLVFYDKFSKWTEFVPLRSATTDTAIRGFRERILARYGVPKILVTDNGTQFTSRKFKQFLADLGIKQQFTAPYSPHENPAERANRTIKTMIAQFTNDQHQKWDDKLPELMLALNSSIAESTGFSPAFLTQGREPRLPKQLFDECTPGSNEPHLNPEQRAARLREIFEIVRRNLELASQEQAHHYNLRRRDWKPQLGDQMLVKTHPLSKASDKFAAKLAPKFDGPYQVIGFDSPVIVRLQRGSEKRVAHVNQLKPFLNSKAPQ